MSTTLSEVLRARRQELGLTLKQIADAVGVTEATVQRWDRGKMLPEYGKLLQIAEVLAIPPQALMGWDSNEQEYRPNTWIPVRGQVAAGLPMEAVEDITDWEEITPEQAETGEYAALRIKGDSMEPRIREGDVVIVHLQDTAETGDTAVVFVNGEDATVKKIKKHENGMSLIPLNPAFEVRFFTQAEIKTLPVTIWGKVVELRGKF